MIGKHRTRAVYRLETRTWTTPDCQSTIAHPSAVSPYISALSSSRIDAPRRRNIPVRAYMVLFWYLSVPVALRRHATLRTPHGGSDAQLRTLAHVVEAVAAHHVPAGERAHVRVAGAHGALVDAVDHLRFRLRFGRNGDARPVARDARPPPPRKERRSLPLLARDDVLDADTPPLGEDGELRARLGAARSVETPDELLLDRAPEKPAELEPSRSSASIAFLRSARAVH